MNASRTLRLIRAHWWQLQRNRHVLWGVFAALCAAVALYLRMHAQGLAP